MCRGIVSGVSGEIPGGILVNLSEKLFEWISWEFLGETYEAFFGLYPKESFTKFWRKPRKIV